MTKTNKRTRYPNWVKEQVKFRYPLCRSTADKEALAQELGIESLHKLYNLASRIGVTRQYDEWYEDDGPDASEAAYHASRDPKRLAKREAFSLEAWSKADDDYIKEYFGKQFIEEISFLRNHTEIAVAYRARQLGMRKSVHYWDLTRVLAWLGLSRNEFIMLSEPLGVQLLPCCDQRGRVKVTLIHQNDLARLFTHRAWWKKLVERGADQYFIREVIEGELASQIDGRESNCWISHGHTCLNPFAGICYGLFYDGTDDKIMGDTLIPADIAPNKVHQLL